MDTTEEQITLAAVRMLTDYKADDGRRFHPDDTLAMIRTLIDTRHPDLDHSQASKAKHCGYCEDRGFYFNDKSWSPEYVGQIPDFDNYGFSVCSCDRGRDPWDHDLESHPEYVSRAEHEAEET